MTNLILSTVRRLRADRAGVTALEYGLIAALVAVVIIPMVITYGTALGGIFTSVTTAM